MEKPTTRNWLRTAGWFLSWVSVTCVVLGFAGHVGWEFQHSYAKHLDDQLHYGLFYRTNCKDSTAMLAITHELSKDSPQEICETARRNWKTSPFTKAIKHTTEHVLEHDVLAPLKDLYSRFFWLFVIIVGLAALTAIAMLSWLCMRGPLQMYAYAVAMGAGPMLPLPGQTPIPNKQL